MKEIKVNARTRKRVKEIKAMSQIKRYTDVVDFLCDCYDLLVDKGCENELLQLVNNYDKNDR